MPLVAGSIYLSQSIALFGCFPLPPPATPLSCRVGITRSSAIWHRAKSISTITRKRGDGKPGQFRFLTQLESVMTQNDFHRSLSRATGESVRTIRALGFSPFDPAVPGVDSDLVDMPPQVVDWDQVELERLALAIQA